MFEVEEGSSLCRPHAASARAINNAQSRVGLIVLSLLQRLQVMAVRTGNRNREIERNRVGPHFDTNWELIPSFSFHASHSVVPGKIIIVVATLSAKALCVPARSRNFYCRACHFGLAMGGLKTMVL